MLVWIHILNTNFSNDLILIMLNEFIKIAPIEYIPVLL